MRKLLCALFVAGLLGASANAQDPLYRVFLDTSGNRGDAAPHPGSGTLSYGNPELPAGGGRLYIYGEFQSGDQTILSPNFDVTIDGGRQFRVAIARRAGCRSRHGLGHSRPAGLRGSGRWPGKPDRLRLRRCVCPRRRRWRSHGHRRSDRRSGARQPDAVGSGCVGSASSSLRSERKVKASKS